MKNNIPSYKTKRGIEDQSYDTILSHILDPKHSELPENLKDRFDRVVYAARELDSLHPANVLPRMLAKYQISRYQAQKDIKLAQELFKSKHDFDYDFWKQWQIKDLVSLINDCKIEGKHKERAAAHKVLLKVLGDQPESTEDPKHMEKNTFVLQLNNNGTVLNLPMESIKGFNNQDIQTLVKTLTAPEVEDIEITKMLDS